MVDLPSTIWKPGLSEGEMSADGGLDFVTLDSVFLVTQDGDQLITKESTFTQLPATVWEVSDGE